MSHPLATNARAAGGGQVKLGCGKRIAQLRNCVSGDLCEYCQGMKRYQAGLIERITMLEHNQRWIPVEEGLPEEYMECQLLIEGVVHCGCFKPECFADYNGEDWGEEYGEVTHWRPLSEPPNESEPVEILMPNGVREVVVEGFDQSNKPIKETLIIPNDGTEAVTKGKISKTGYER